MDNNIKVYWKGVVGYEDKYIVNTLGMIYSIKSGIFLRPAKTKKGYMRVMLYNNGQRRSEYVHRIVAQAFLPNPDNLPEVNHKNEIKNDNRLENLAWISKPDNCRYGTKLERQVETLLNNGKTSQRIAQYDAESGALTGVFRSMAEAERMNLIGNGKLSRKFSKNDVNSIVYRDKRYVKISEDVFHLLYQIQSIGTVMFNELS